MKKILASVLAASVLALSMAGCGSPASSSASSGAAVPAAGTASAGTASAASNSAKKLRVALVYSGNLGDKSFNDSAHAGALKAEKDFGVEVKELESTQSSEWESNFVACASDGYDLVIGVSSQFEDIMKKHCPQYPNVKFAILDDSIPGDNVISYKFAQNEGSFLAGAAAAMFTTKTDVPGINSQKVIGWVGGMDIPVLHDFFVGYEQGAKYIDPDVKVLQSFAGSFSDPVKGKELTIAQYSQGADIVMNVASGTGNGILEAAKDKGEFAVGVDSDQDSLYPGSILTSMVKHVDVGTYSAIEAVVKGTFKGNTTTMLNVANGGIQLTDMSVMKKALGDKFPPDILTKIQDITGKIKSGEIKVNHYQGFTG